MLPRSPRHRVGLFFLLTAAAFAPFLTVRLPSRMDGLRRLDRKQSLQHRPATTISDDLAADRQDSFAVTLWRTILSARYGRQDVAGGAAFAALATRDPMRCCLVVVALIASFFIAGSDRMRRIYAAFNWQGVMAPANFRIDAWVNPPNYTGKPPVVLAAMRPGEPVPQSPGPLRCRRAARWLSAPRTGQPRCGNDRRHRRRQECGGQERGQGCRQGRKHFGRRQDRRQEHRQGWRDERRLVITEAGTVTLRSAVANDIVWRFTAIPDRAPPSRSPRIPSPSSAGPCSSRTSSRMTTALSARRLNSS